MAKGGRDYLFGDGGHKINPIHGADLARATVDAVDQGRETINVGGPDIFTHRELAELAFDTLKKPQRFTYIWDGFRKMIINVLPWVSPITVYGPAQFFLTAMVMDIVGECQGKHHLSDYFRQVIQEEHTSIE